MKNNKLILLIGLLSLNVICNLRAESQNYDHTTITTQCQVQEASGLFVLNVLFTNSENAYPIELWENRDNEEMNIFDIARAIKSIASAKGKILSDSNELERTFLLERLAQMEDIADRALLMEADKWKPSYVNELTKHIIGIRHAGISALLPGKVDPSNCKDDSDQRKKHIVNPCDENGQPWSYLLRLSDPDTEGPSIANYMKVYGTDIQLIKDWWENQLSSSWNSVCKSVKVFFSNQRTLDPKSYYWSRSGSYELAQGVYSYFWKNDLEGGKEALYIKAFTIWHAYVQEVLSKVKFFHNQQSNRQVCLIRTNGLDALKYNNITQFGKGYTMPSASYDSFSLINIFEKEKSGSVITESLVPHHRIIQIYSLINPVFHESLTKYKIEKITDLIIKNYYDDGLLTIHKKNISEVEQCVEKLLNLKASQYGLLLSLDDKEMLRIIEILPEKLPIDDEFETLFKVLIQMEKEKNLKDPGFFDETEFVVLSGPDLPFDYFYNTGEGLSDYERRLDSGESVCGFWPSIDNLEQIGNLDGNIGALLYQDSKTGKKYVLKKGASAGNIREEALADLLYEASGIKIPESRLYQTPEGPVKVATYLENAKSLAEAYSNSDETGQQQLRNKVSEGFVIDALLDNFDVIGLEMNNILVGENGEVFRVNTGASFRYNAQGEFKNDTPYKSWNPSPMALWTLRDPEINPNAALIFADLNIYEIAETINKFGKISNVWDKEAQKYQEVHTLKNNDIFKQAPNIKLQIETRFHYFSQVATKALKMKKQGIPSEEADRELRKWAEEKKWGPVFR